MPKIYSDEDVLTAALKRIHYIFEHFDNVCLSLSGGKDSSVMVQLTDMIADELDREYDVLSIHLEAQYLDTIKHIEYLRDNMKHIQDFYWVCLPLSLRNAVSVFEPKWTCWDPEKKDKWIRQMPDGAITMENNPFPFFEPEMEFEEFTPLFGEWYSSTHKGKCCQGVAIRSDESLNRFRTIVSDKKDTYNGLNWTTQLKIHNEPIDMYNF